MRTFWLNFHVTYACRHSGACCTSGWPIPVEHDRVIPIQRIIDRDDAVAPTPWLVPAPGAPADVAGTLALTPSGACTFFRLPTSSTLPTRSALPTGSALPTSSAPGSCRVHPARPSSCAHFPYVCLIDARGVHVTLSHYCPTAAALLFSWNGPAAIVEGPSPVAGIDVPEGLDARESLPPLASPARLMSFEEFSEWERSEVAAPALPVDDAVARFEDARAAVPAPLSWPAAPADFARVWTRLVGPAWGAFQPVLDRYRAAKVHASWAAYHGDGLSSVRAAAARALAVVCVEAARQCERADRPLDAPLLVEAIRQSDLLLLHYADPRVLSSAASGP